MIHIKNSKPNSIFLLEHEGVPSALVTDFNELIVDGSLCVDVTNQDLYILRNSIWSLVSGGGGSSTASLVSLSDVKINAPININDVLQFDGTNWINVSNVKVTDSAFYEYDWIEYGVAPSRNSVNQLIQSLGNFSRILVVDATYGSDYVNTPPQQTGQRERLLRPYQTLSRVQNEMQSGDCIILMPGTYVTDFLFPGLSLRDNCTLVLINATILKSSGTYSPLFNYPNTANNVRVIGIGDSKIINNTVSGWGGIVTPYVDSQYTFENLTLISQNQIYTGLGGSGLNKFAIFKNCNIIQHNSVVNTVAGGVTGAPVIFDNCNVTGYTAYVMGGGASNINDKNIKYDVYAKNSTFRAVDTNSNGKSYVLNLVDYYTDSAVSKMLFENCHFEGTNGSLIVTENGYGGFGTNKYLLLTNCTFTGSTSGWINNNHPNVQFKLRGNYSQYPAMGAYPVNNLLSSGTNGMIIDINVE